MTLEQQVTNLELSKRLKELGCRQESLFCWAKQCVGTHPITHQNLWDYRIMPNTFQAEIEYISAFTVAELGEMLRKYCWAMYRPYEDKWQCQIEIGDKLHHVAADTEADARAKMLIYLIENKLITNQEPAS